MSNWSDAAKRISARRQEDEAQQQAAEQAFEAGAAEAARYLELFMEQQGSEAMELLKAARTVIEFGNSDFAKVYLSADGLCYAEEGFPVGNRELVRRPATSREVVEYYACYGAGSRCVMVNHDYKRMIEWLRAQLDAIAAEA